MATKTEPFDVGDDVTVTFTFTDAATAPQDPTVVATQVQSVADHATGTVTRTLAIGDLTRVSQGVYKFVQRLTDGGGLWRIKATATLAGGAQQVRYRTIEVSASPEP